MGLINWMENTGMSSFRGGSRAPLLQARERRSARSPPCGSVTLLVRGTGETFWAFEKVPGARCRERLCANVSARLGGWSLVPRPDWRGRAGLLATLESASDEAAGDSCREPPSPSVPHPVPAQPAHPGAPTEFRRIGASARSSADDAAKLHLHLHSLLSSSKAPPSGFRPRTNKTLSRWSPCRPGCVGDSGALRLPECSQREAVAALRHLHSVSRRRTERSVASSAPVPAPLSL